MRVKVLRVSNMPHGVQIWVDRQPDRCDYYVDKQLVTAYGARLLELAATANAQSLLAQRRRDTAG
jgi:hypothetical protein